MSIATLAELTTAVISWSSRVDDTDFADQVPNFIALAEAGLNRGLRVRAMEASFASAALADGAVDLPDDFLAWKELRYDGAPGWTLEPRPLEWIRSQGTSADSPGYFAVTGTQTVFWPQTGSVTGTYYERIPSLVDEDTNWLLTSHPDLYLFAVLTEAAIWTLDEQRAVMWRERARALLDEVQSQDNANQLGGGPLIRRQR